MLYCVARRKQSSPRQSGSLDCTPPCRSDT